MPTPAAMRQLKLTYFAFRGIAEPIRQALYYGGIDYYNERIPMEEWPERKKEMPFEQLPVLDVNGLQIPQSNSIIRYVAKEAELYGKNDEEAALIDAIADLWTEYWNEIRPFRALFGEPESEQKEKVRHEVFYPARDRFFRFLTNYLKKNPSGYLVGDRLSFCDLIVAEHLHSFERRFSGYTKDFPELQDLVKKVHNEPNLKSWFKNRPDDPY